MFRITYDPSSRSDNLYLIEITHNGSVVFIMCVVGIWRQEFNLMPPNTDHVHNKHNWTIIRNFNQVEIVTPWWWIVCDPKHVGVYFNVCLLDFYRTDFNVYDCYNWVH